jgi:hypothetical protein
MEQHEQWLVLQAKRQEALLASEAGQDTASDGSEGRIDGNVTVHRFEPVMLREDCVDLVETPSVGSPVIESYKRGAKFLRAEVADKKGLAGWIEARTLSGKKGYIPTDTKVKKIIGVSRTALNVRAFIGLFIFGWLMMMNYSDLNKPGFGWAFLITMAPLFMICTRGLAGNPNAEAIAGVLLLLVYCGAWIHTNVILSNLQREYRVASS